MILVCAMHSIAPYKFMMFRIEVKIISYIFWISSTKMQPCICTTFSNGWFNCTVNFV